MVNFILGRSVSLSPKDKFVQGKMNLSVFKKVTFTLNYYKYCITNKVTGPIEIVLKVTGPRAIALSMPLCNTLGLYNHIEFGSVFT